MEGRGGTILPLLERERVEPDQTPSPASRPAAATNTDWLSETKEIKNTRSSGVRPEQQPQHRNARAVRIAAGVLGEIFI